MGTSVLHIKTEVECKVFLFDEEKGIATPGKYFNLEVRKGEQDLLFVSTENNGVQYPLKYEVTEEDYNYQIRVEKDAFKTYSSELLRLIQSAERGDAGEQYTLGKYYYDKKEYIEAILWLRRAANQGSADAQSLIGFCYAIGNGVEKNTKEAIKWFRSAAENGSVGGQYIYGLCLLKGRDIEKNELEGLKWLHNVSKKIKDAQQQIEECYLDGIVLEEDYENAILFYQAEQQKDNPRAQYQLGMCYKNGIVVEKNNGKAYELFLKSANHGDDKAQYELGLFYQKAVGNKSVASVWFKKSAEKGNIEAQCALGYCYYFGEGVRQDYEDAKKWFERSAIQGNAIAQYAIGMGYRRGDWERQSYEEARKWAKLSAEQGYAPGQKDLANSYYYGWVIKDYSEAVRWYRKAAEQGDKDAQYHLGVCFRDGKGVSPNNKLAAKWMQMAAQNGHAEAIVQCKKHYPIPIVDEIEDTLNVSEPFYLFFDTETTGLPKNYHASTSDSDNWPHLVQISWILTDEKGNAISSGNEIIKPEGFVIPFESVKVHGISTTKALKDGKPLFDILSAFLKDAKRASCYVGHNISFDQKVVGAELYRLGLPDTISNRKSICTMQSSTNFCKIPDVYGYKYPKLQELYSKLFGGTFDDAHNALADVRATMKCFFELKRLGVIK